MLFNESSKLYLAPSFTSVFKHARWVQNIEANQVNSEAFRTNGTKGYQPILAITLQKSCTSSSENERQQVEKKKRRSRIPKCKSGVPTNRLSEDEENDWPVMFSGKESDANVERDIITKEEEDATANRCVRDILKIT